MNRTRTVGKSLWFSDAEWDAVQARMAAAGIDSFSTFARVMLLNGEVRVDRSRHDASRILAALAPIGNNINQIARQVNTEKHVHLDQLERVHELMRSVQSLLRDSESGE